MNNLDEVALLITHYNRSQSLTRLLQSFKDQQFIFGEIIVSDDASLPSHQLKLKQLQNEFGFKLITTPQNKGLGHNINKGQDAVTKPYTLYIQEDFIPIPGCANHLLNALQLMQNNERLDIIRFYAYFTYPDLKPYQKGFSEMVFKWRTINHLKFYYYSDHPHLRRSSFLQKFGRYPEGNSSDLTEYKMAISFIKKNGKGLFYNQFNTLFDQCNSLAEPSTVPRSNWRQSKKILVLAIRAVYLKYKLLKGHADLLLANS
ncbi:MAG: glycosyltransferase family 2 protein [Sphingobacteriaceae bacterium]|nr:MAG: glycosyltransferase family 2 protein [Sphingobacteriaceae bacterium]